MQPKKKRIRPYTEKAREWVYWHNRSYMGFLRKRYQNMKTRMRPRVSGKGCPVPGPLLTKEEFMKWAEGSVYPTMFYAWKAAGHPRSLTPTIDRIDCSKGYVLGNIQWLTMEANTQKGMVEKPRRKRTKSRFQGVSPTASGKRWKATIAPGGNRIFIGTFDTEEEAAQAYQRHRRAAFAHLGLPPEAFELPGTVPEAPTQPLQP